MQTSDNHVIVLFGASGDLAKRKLLPGLFHLAVAGLMPDDFRIIGSAPTPEMSTEEFRDYAHDSISEFGRRELTDARWKDFSERLSYCLSSPEDFGDLVAAVDQAESEIGGDVRRLHHLAIPPVAFVSMVEMLGASKLAERSRVIIEKPFGTDLASAKELNATIADVFDESQLFRIDHYLGKEAVDSILSLRFGNGLFERVWNRDYISHVEIDVAESISIENRAAFYEQTGAFRDMVVTHLFQVLGFAAMEPPTSLSAAAMRDEKAKVFSSMADLDPAQVVRGQYDGYRDEDGVADDSQVETFVALKAHIDNWRWADVPFYLRTGKCMAEARQQLTLVFHDPPLRMFEYTHDTIADQPNAISIEFSDPGSISLRFRTKQPGPTMNLDEASLSFTYAGTFQETNQLSGYERLIHDALLGDQTFFTRSDSIERLWEIATPLLEDPPPVEPYWRRSWGPRGIIDLVAPDTWQVPPAE